MAEDSQGRVGTIKARLQALRQRYRFVDHLLLMNDHYNDVQGGVLAGAVTYFGFLSFFPILSLGFAVVGYIGSRFPGAQDSLTTALEQVLPGIVSAHGTGNTISLDDIENSKQITGIIGFFGLLYAGLGWLSGLRVALQESFRVPKYQQGNFILGKATDLLMLAILGVVMIVSVGIAGFVQGWAGTILHWLGLDDTFIGKPLIVAVGVVLGLAASTLLFFVMYKLLGRPMLPILPLIQGAFLGAVGFEILKFLVVNVIGHVGGSTFAQLAVAVTLVVWINYFSRLVFYGASWAMTARRPGHAPGPLDQSEAAVAVADLADAKSRLPVGQLATTAAAPGRATFDAGSALLGAVAGAVAAAVWGRSKDTLV
jgi:membrane protein